MDIRQVSVEIIKNIGSAVAPLRHFKEKHSQKRINLLASVDTQFGVFDNLIARCGGTLDLDGKVILELGPGYSLTMALLFLAMGARKVYLIDRFKHLFWDKQDIAYHRKALNKIKEMDLPYVPSAMDALSFSEHSDNIALNHNKIEFRSGDAASIPLGDSSIDIVFSNAVMEHVHNVRKAIDEIHRVTRNEGLGIHEIDLRDHFFAQTPLRLLQYPDWLWNLMTWFRPGYTNRLRLADYIKLFESYGFEIGKYTVTRRHEGVLDHIELHPRFNIYPTLELEVLAFWVLLKKI